MNDPIKIRVLSVEQPLGSFYVGVINSKDLAFLAKFDYRKLSKIDKTKGDTFYKNTGIQRQLSKSRVNEIKEYVTTIDASFPNSIIIHINVDDVEQGDGYLDVARKRDAVTIIDGQHRLAGFIDNPLDPPFELIVTIFVEMEPQELAYIFATINTKHTRISPSLAQDLLEFSTIETPEKLAHNIAKKFNTQQGSPWRHEIKMLGKKDELSNGIITQYSFTKEIVDLIYNTKNSAQIRNELKIHKNKREILKKKFDFNHERYPYWPLYVKNLDSVIYKSLNNYFLVLKDFFSKEWRNKNYILTKTTGYYAIMRGLRNHLPEGIRKNDLSKEYFKPIIEMAKSHVDEYGKQLTNDNFKAGGVGKKDLYNLMFEGIMPDDKK